MCRGCDLDILQRNNKMLGEKGSKCERKLGIPIVCWTQHTLQWLLKDSLPFADVCVCACMFACVHACV